MEVWTRTLLPMRAQACSTSATSITSLQHGHPVTIRPFSGTHQSTSGEHFEVLKEAIDEDVEDVFGHDPSRKAIALKKHSDLLTESHDLAATTALHGRAFGAILCPLLHLGNAANSVRKSWGSRDQQAFTLGISEGGRRFVR